jgi:hypothetical protein
MQFVETMHVGQLQYLFVVHARSGTGRGAMFLLTT